VDGPLPAAAALIQRERERRRTAGMPASSGLAYGLMLARAVGSS